jgi:hypothetical protein
MLLFTAYKKEGEFLGKNVWDVGEGVGGWVEQWHLETG